MEKHDHLVTSRVNDFIITEDQHFMDYQKDPKYILIKSVNEDGLTLGNLGTAAPPAGPMTMAKAGSAISRRATC